METALATKQHNPIKVYFEQEAVKKKFQELLGSRTTQWLTSLLSLVNNSDYLKKAKPETIYTSAMMAASLDMPINQNLGFAYIIPYGDQAQFQMGYKGFIQLAQRSGQFKTISAAPIYANQIVESNPLTGYVFDFTKKAEGAPVGYAAYFSLLNGFEKTLYMTIEQIEAHGKKFSKTFGHANGLWKKDFEAMATKTVIKLLLSKFAPLSVEMQRAVIADQSVIKDVDTLDVEYIDEGNEEITHEALKQLLDERCMLLETKDFEEIRKILDNKQEKDYKRAYKLLQNAKEK